MAPARATRQSLVLVLCPHISQGLSGSSLGTISASIHQEFPERLPCARHLVPTQEACCSDPSKPWPPGGNIDEGLVCAGHCSGPRGVWQ